MRMYLAGQWQDRPRRIEVQNPFDGAAIDSVPAADAADVDRAIAAAVSGAEAMRKLSGYERFEILARGAKLIGERSEWLAHQLSREEGKTLAEARGEIARSRETLELSAEEAKRLSGEVLPLDGASSGAGNLGFTLRIPCGVVAAITPFNFPLNLVCHKVGPALAAGNAVVLKPASSTPLSALSLVEILLEAGLPPLGIACVTGAGATLGDAIATDSRVRKISFTGSRDVGERILKQAGIKRVTMELGSNCPLIVLADADLEKVAAATAATGFANAGQVCISTQRVIVDRPVYGDFLDALKPLVAAIRTGNPQDPSTNMGPMIRPAEADRVHDWIGQAVAAGARVVTGGERSGGLHQPTVLAEVAPEMRISRDEVFGPVVGVTRADGFDAAIALANDSRYGLGAAIFTNDLGRAMRFAREVDAGNLHINWGPGWRADLMPYGGLKDSGLGREGPRYAVEEMSEWKTVVIHGA